MTANVELTNEPTAVEVTEDGVEITLTQEGIAVDLLTGVTRHGNLTGLDNDDHPQYHTDARALTWLGTRSTDDLPEGASNLYDQTVILTGGTGISVSGAYPSFTITNTQSGAVWGNITGTLSDQADLQSALDDKLENGDNAILGDLTVDALQVGGNATFFSSAEFDDEVQINGLSNGLVAASSNVLTNFTMSTDRILGRGTAGTGAPEELQAGTGLSIASGAVQVDSYNDIAFTDQANTFSEPQRTTVQGVNASSSVTNISLDDAQIFNVRVSANTTLNITNISPGQTGAIYLTYLGNFTVTVANTAYWIGGEQTFTNTSGAIDRIGFEVPFGTGTELVLGQNLDLQAS